MAFPSSASGSRPEGGDIQIGAGCARSLSQAIWWGGTAQLHLTPKATGSNLPSEGAQPDGLGVGDVVGNGVGDGVGVPDGDGDGEPVLLFAASSPARRIAALAAFTSAW